MLQFSGDATFGKTTVGKLLSFDTFFSFLAAQRIMGEANALACLHIAKGQLPVGFNLPIMEGASTVGGFKMTIRGSGAHLRTAPISIFDRNDNVVSAKALIIDCQNCIDRASDSPGFPLHLRSVDYLSYTEDGSTEQQHEHETKGATKDLHKRTTKRKLPFMSQVGVLVPFVEWAQVLSNSGFTVHLWEYDKAATEADQLNEHTYKSLVDLIPSDLYIVTLTYSEVVYESDSRTESIRTLICSPIGFNQNQIESRLSLDLNPYSGDMAAEHFARAHISADESYGGIPHILSRNGDLDALQVMNNILSSDRWIIDSSGVFNSIASRTSYGLGEGGFSQFNSVLLKHGNLNSSILASLSNAIDNGMGRRVGFDTLSEGHFTGILQTGTLHYAEKESFVVVTTSRPDRERVDLLMRVDFDPATSNIYVFHAPSLNRNGMHPYRSFVVTMLPVRSKQVQFGSRVYNTSLQLNSTVGKLVLKAKLKGEDGQELTQKGGSKDRFDWGVDNQGISFADWIDMVTSGVDEPAGHSTQRVYDPRKYAEQRVLKWPEEKYGR